MLLYYRCNDCLCSMTVPAEVDTFTARCACGGVLTFMGQVVQDRITEERHRCKCDERCTNAAGPICNCHCGGENHGAGKAAEINYLVDKGPAILRPPDPRSPYRAAEYRELRDQVQALVKGNGYGQHGRQRLLDKACNLRTHKSRNARLEVLRKVFTGGTQ